MTAQLTIPRNALSESETVPFTALTFTTRVTLQTLHIYQHVPQELCTEAERLGLTPTGPIQYVYTDVTGDGINEFGLEIALPVRQTDEKPFGFSYKVFGSFRCLSYTFSGPWNELITAYDALFATINQAGYQTNNRVREVYTVVDLAEPENCVTVIQIGLI